MSSTRENANRDPAAVVVELREARETNEPPRADASGRNAADELAGEKIDASTPASKRKRLRGILMLGGIAAVVVVSGIMWLRGGRYVSTDDAYVRSAKLMVSTDVSGIVSSIDVKQGQRVKAGDVLFRLDDRQFRNTLEQARAQLAQTKLNIEALRQDYQRIQEDITTEAALVDLARTAFDRAQALARSNFGTRAQLDQTRYSLAAEESKLASLKQQAAVALVRLGGTLDAPIESNPQVMQAQSQADEAQRVLDRSVVRAPFNGIVTAVEQLQVGTYLVSQTAALTNTGAVGLVSEERVWIDANIKETDLTYVKTGDHVSFTVDAYPRHEWSGKVDTIYPATGAEFSILPAQNAGGNWVKIVQRLPVRIAIDRTANDPPLRSGMSAVVDIDTQHTRSVDDLWHLIGLGSRKADTENR
ncbi:MULTISPECIES: HlyD family secretion protein [unclassified Beijerinckia]|uniref:HlyD family secretion protein n=1 Tax=unclassified Beijerinckia TaxID=2638183 RepID=UPI00089A6E47|nr:MULTISPECIES: HlyD family secretion protein [unclassified Beijerinckia]MDH7797331.1 membrane fusion protein (multidrug efflux system) [Beijerinckia sp. GAS462]SEC81333.1 membrane fusion protein, multidrug efflux system [Beijerinckia sp. 28-YEA-48]